MCRAKTRCRQAMRAIERGLSSIDIGRPFLAGDMGVLLSARSGASGSGRVPPSTVFFLRDIAVRAGVLVRVWRLHTSGR